MMLAASKGTELKLVAEGSDANMALEAVAALINDKFGEE
jgi:phosphocarrier protein